MAVYVSDYLQSGKPALGGSYSGLLVQVARVDLTSALAVNDEIELFPIDGTAKMFRLSITENGTAITGAFANLVHEDANGNRTTLLSGIGEGVYTLYDLAPPSDGKLLLVATATSTGATQIVVGLEIYYD